jgi:hypothetical protein
LVRNVCDTCRMNALIRLVVKRRGFGVPSNFNLPFWSNILEILVSKHQYLPLGGVQGQLVQSFFRKLADLDTFDLCPKEWAYIVGLDVGLDEVWKCRVGASARIGVFFRVESVRLRKRNRGRKTYRKARSAEISLMHPNVENRKGTKVLSAYKRKIYS